MSATPWRVRRVSRVLCRLPRGFVVGSAILLLASADRAWGADPKSDPELKRIADALRKWRKSFVNIRVKCEWTWEKGHLGSVKDRDTRSGCDWIWTDSGKYRSYRWSLNHGKYDGDSLVAVDGNRQYVFRTPRGDAPKEPFAVEVSPAPPPSSRKTVFRALAGLWYPSKSMWLDELLDAGKAELAGSELVDGRKLPRLKVTRPNGFQTTVVVDPLHGFLPRIQGERNGHFNEIREYQYLDKAGMWFPRKGTLTIWDRQKGAIYARSHWTVTEVKVNTQLPLSLFRPRIPDGTRVLDGLSGRRYFQGGKPRPGEKRFSAETPTGDAERVSAAPRPGFWQRWSVPLLLAASACLLAGALIVRRRLRRAEESLD